jgi:MatE
MHRSTSSTSQLIRLVIHLVLPVLVAQTSGGCAALSGRVAAKPPGTPGLPFAGISILPAGRAACDDAHAVIDTAMAWRLSAIDLASVGIAASITATVMMTLVSVLLALPAIIAHLYGAGRAARAG